MSVLIDATIDLDNDSEEDKHGKWCNRCRFESFEFCLLFEKSLGVEQRNNDFLKVKRCKMCLEMASDIIFTPLK